MTAGPPRISHSVTKFSVSNFHLPVLLFTFFVIRHGDTITPVPPTWYHQSVMVTAAEHLVDTSIIKKYRDAPW